MPSPGPDTKAPPRPVASLPCAAVVAGMPAGGDRDTLLRDTLRRAGFWRWLEARRHTCGVGKAELRVVIQPDLDAFDSATPTGTEPRLVERLIHLLHQRGYRTVSVVNGVDRAALWLENREVPTLARLLGYRGTTDAGRSYEIIDLSRDLVDGGFPQHSILAGSALGRAWLEAHVRISFAKNKTDEEHGFSLGLQNLLGVLPLRDKDYHYRHRLDTGDVIVELLRRTPVHFSLIDAVISNHGGEGTCRVTPLHTGTLVAGPGIVLIEWAAALKMGVDPYVSALTARVLREVGLPPNHRIDGDLTPYKGWRNPSPLALHSVRHRYRSVSVRRTVRPWLQPVNRDLFPFKNPVDDRMNRLVAGFLESRTDAVSGLARIGVNHLLGASRRLADCYGALVDKGRIRRRRLSLGFDPSAYALSDYEAMVDYMEPFADIAAATPANSNGLRRRYIDNAVLFAFRRVLPVRYDDLVSRVDMSAVMRMMNDHIGGAGIPVAVDDDCRITHLAERDIYLPQPNWLILFGADVIDVGKLVFIHYEKDCRRIYWRTVAGANRSATCDDGHVSFERCSDGTEIAVVARRQLNLPRLWQAFDVNCAPSVRDRLVDQAYATFFSRTIAHIEAACEGRDTAIGRPWDACMGEPDGPAGKTPLETAARTFIRFVAFAQPVVSALRAAQRAGSLRALGLQKLAGPELAEYIETGFRDKALGHMLRLMALALTLRPDLQRDLCDFSARYLFALQDRDVVAHVVFEGGVMRVYDAAGAADVSVTFRDLEACFNVLLSAPDADVMQALLSQDVAVDGNLNYLYRFACMAGRLRHWP